MRLFARPSPPRPPLETPERVRALSQEPSGTSFITGNGVAAHCRYVLNYDQLTVNEQVENDWWFCKADFLEYFFRQLAPGAPFVLFSHNSDVSVGRPFLRRLRSRRLIAWFAANAVLAQPKLFALPLGVANPIWPHGDSAALKAVQQAMIPKQRLFDVSFRIETNPAERLRCLEATGMPLEAPAPFPEYLQRLASSYFCIAPRGNGVDTHRVWEALYLRTIPVVIRSVLTDQHADLPMVVLDDWSDFGSIDFSPGLYRRVWADWDPAAISLDAYLDRVRAILAEQAGA